MTDRMTAWTNITAGLNEILDAAETIEGFELNEDDEAEQIEIIRAAAQKVRTAAHEYIKPE